MTREEFKAYLDMVVEKAFKEGVLYERNRANSDDDAVSFEDAIWQAKVIILGD